MSYGENRARLEGGDFATPLESLSVNYDFSPDLRPATLVQADNVTDNLGLQSRLRWIHADGREFFPVVDSSWVKVENGAIVPVEQNIALKIEYAFRW